MRPDHARIRTWLRDRLANLGQTFFIPDARLGLLMVIATAVIAPWSAAGAVAGALLSRAAAERLHARQDLVHAGLFEINGFFYGLAVVAFVPEWYRAVLLLAAGSLMVAGLTIACGRILRTWNLPVLVLPYLMVMWMVFSMRAYWPAPEPGLPGPLALDLDLPWLAPLVPVAFGAICGISQIFYQYSLVTGLVMCAGVAWVRPRAAWALVWGSAVSSAMALAIGASAADVSLGFFGFSGALLAVALTEFNPISPLRRVLSVAILGLLTTAIGPVFYKMGLSASALPYVLLVWGVGLVAPTQAKVPAKATSSALWAPPSY
jgi:urea transporter